MRQGLETERVDTVRAFLLYGSIPVGLIAVCFILGTHALLALPLSGPLLVLAFCGTFVVYQAERVVWTAPEDALNQPGRLAWAQRHRGYVGVSTVLAAGVGMGMVPLLRPETLAAGVALGVVSLLYMAPVLPHRRRLKAIWYAKPLAIASAWALGGVLLPILEAGRPLAPFVFALAAYRMLFVLPNALLADWPDREGDAEAGLHTVATRLAATQLRWMSVVSLLGALAGGAVALTVFQAGWLLGVDMIGPGLLLAVVLRPWPVSRLFYGLLIDLIIAWPAVTALGAWLAEP